MRRPVLFLICFSAFLFAVSDVFPKSPVWTKVNGPKTGALTALEVDSAGTIYAALGTLRATGSGVFRSEDDGKTWTLLGNGLPAEGFSVYEYHLLNVNDSILFAGADAGFNQGTGSGLYRSSDHGNSWVDVTPPVPVYPDGLSYRDVFALTSDADGAVYCGVNDGIYRTTDFGSTWTAIFGASTRDIVLAVDSANCVNAIVNNTMLRSSDHGLTWQSNPLSFGAINSLTIAPDGAFYAGGWPLLRRSTDRGQTWDSIGGEWGIHSMTSDNSGAILAGESWWGLHRSTDYGETWEIVNQNWYTRTVKSLFADKRRGRIFAGTESCDLYVSSDGGSSWKHLASIGSLNIVVQHFLISKNSGYVFTGSSDPLEKTFRSSDHGTSWYRIEAASADMVSCAYNSSGDILTCYGWRSTDHGDSWSQDFDFSTIFGPRHDTFVINASDQLFASSMSDGIYSSTNEGYSWFQVNNGFTTDAASCMTIATNGDLFAGTWSHVFRSTDDGQSWTRHTQGLTFPTVSAIGCDSSGFVLAGTWGGGIFRSSNNGDQWHKVSSGRLDTLKISIFAVAPNGEVFAGTYDDTGTQYNGIYHSTDHGSTWREANDGLEDLRVLTLAADGFGNIFAGTAGGGVFKAIVLPQAPLGIPQPLAPPRFAAGQVMNVTLTWTYVTGAVNYHLQVSTDSSFASNLIFDDSVFNDTTYNVPGLKQRTTYFWRVRAVGPSEMSGWSEIWPFSTGVQIPAGPRLIYPDSVKAAVPLSVSLTWGSVPEAARYVVQVGGDSAFSRDLLLNDSTVTDTFRTVTDLLPGRTYFWRVQGANSAGSGPWSPIWPFTTAVPPAWIPALILPLDGQSNVPDSLALHWGPIAGAVAYHVMLSRDSNFVLGALVNDSTVADTFRTISDLKPDSRYFWKVRAGSDFSWGQWSNTWGFRTNVALPGPVSLLVPSNQSAISRDSARFVWTRGQPAVDLYWFELAADSLFTFRFVDSTVTDTFKVIVNNLIAGHKFWWKVRAGNAAGWGAFSAVSSCLTVVDAVRETKKMPTDFSLSQNFPNPFNPVTVVRYALPHRAQMTLFVFNALGEKVAELVNGDVEAGYHEVEFNATGLASGVYFYRMQARSQDPGGGESGTFTKTRKLVLVR